MHLRGDSPHTHGPGGEASDDVTSRFHLIQWNWSALSRLESEQPPQGHEPLGLIVHGLRVFAENVKAPTPRRVLELEYCFGVEQVRRPLPAPLILSTHGETLVGVGDSCCGVGTAVSLPVLLRQNVEINAPQDGGGSGEILSDQLFAKTHRLERLSSGVRGNR